MQFIVTTHAPSVIASVGREHVRILEGDSTRVPANQTYGREASSIYREVMGAPERMPDVAALFDAFYRRLDDDDFEGASDAVKLIEAKIGSMDPELTAARTSLFLME